MSKIINQYKAKQVMEGAGVLVNRVFGHSETKEFDPFLMLDYFASDDMNDSPGFPWHPHKGIETITYFLKGSGTHEDSMGNKGVIGENELQWMSAGRGIYHQEMPESGPNGIEGFQFWVNLPANQKLKDPDYKYIKNGEMKTVELEGVLVRVISGKYGDIIGPIDKSDLGITMLHITINEGSNITLHREDNKQGYVFLFGGVGSIDGETVQAVTAYTLDAGDINIVADSGNMELIFAEGQPLNEPIAWRGPVVMNTEEELFETFRDLNKGTFIE